MEKAIFEMTSLNLLVDVLKIARVRQKLIAFQQQPFAGELGEFIRTLFQGLDFLPGRMCRVLGWLYVLHRSFSLALIPQNITLFAEPPQSAESNTTTVWRSMMNDLAGFVRPGNACQKSSLPM